MNVLGITPIELIGIATSALKDLYKDYEDDHKISTAEALNTVYALGTKIADAMDDCIEKTVLTDLMALLAHVIAMHHTEPPVKA